MALGYARLQRSSYMFGLLEEHFFGEDHYKRLCSICSNNKGLLGRDHSQCQTQGCEKFVCSLTLHF